MQIRILGKLAFIIGVMCICNMSFSEEKSVVVYEADFELDLYDWVKQGPDTTLVLDEQESYKGENSAKIYDGGDRVGQANTSRIMVEKGKNYFIELWVKSDPAYSATTKVDLVLWDADEELKGTYDVAVIKKAGKWIPVSSLFTPPEGVAYITIRIMPAIGRGENKGACWFDSVTIKEIKDMITLRRIGADIKPVKMEKVPVGQMPPGIRKKAIYPYNSKPLVDFERMSGWRMATSKKITASFYQSRTEQLEGEYVAKVIYSTEASGQWVELIPPAPILIDRKFDSVSLWIFRRQQEGLQTSAELHSKTSLVDLYFEDRNKRIFSITLSPIKWAFWSIAHYRAEEAIIPPVKLVSIMAYSLPSGENHELCFDALAVYTAPRKEIEVSLDFKENVSFPTSADTILPSCLEDTFENKVYKKGQDFVFEYNARDEKIKYYLYAHPDALYEVRGYYDNLGPYSILHDAGPSLNVQGEIYSGADILYKLITSDMSGQKVHLSYQLSIKGLKEKIEYLFSIKQKTLIIEVSSLSKNISEFTLGEVAGSDVERVDVPYLDYSRRPDKDTPLVYMLDREIFLSRFIDWYNSGASVLSNASSYYYPATNGLRNKLKEKIFITLSKEFREVLPNIPNPPSKPPWNWTDYIYLNLSGLFKDDTIDRFRSFLRECKRYNLENLIVKHHAGTWCSTSGRGYEPWSQTADVALSMPGGEEGFKEYLRGVKKLGYKVGLYNEHTVSYNPNNSNWDEDFVALDSEGQWKEGWIQCKVTSPLRIPDIVREEGIKLKEKFSPDLIYEDCMTASPFWERIDYDARKPFAGKLKEAFLSNAQAVLLEKETLDAVVIGEGGAHMFFAGIFDGNYATLRTSYPRYKIPFLVDFDLLKIHPLEADLGMGWGPPYYDLSVEEGKKESSLDRFLCASIAFGHLGIMYYPYVPLYKDINPDNPLGENKPYLIRIYHLMQPLQSRYAYIPPEHILYHSNGEFYPVSEAIKNKAYLKNQVYVKYKNGLMVYCNGSLDDRDNWRISLGDKEYLLPPTGFLAYMPGELLEYSATVGGSRVDFVDSPSFLYADGRGKETDFGLFKTKGQVIIKKAQKEWEVILCSRDAITINLKKVKSKFNLARIRAYDREGNELSHPDINTTGDSLSLYPYGDLTNYLLLIE